MKIKIKSIRKLEKKRKVYDLSVQGNHNFFITNKKILTHNCDYMTPNSQAALRNLMQGQYSKLTRFVLTCNYHERIIEPIVSRCQVFEVIPPSRKDVAIHAAKILQKENVEFNPQDIKVLVDSTYPDIRQLINSCQRNSTEGRLIVDRAEIIDSDFKLKLLETLTQKEKKGIFKSIRQLVADNHISDFTEIYRFLYDKVDEYAPTKVPHIITILADGLKYDTFIVDKEINFMDSIIKLITEL